MASARYRASNWSYRSRRSWGCGFRGSYSPGIRSWRGWRLRPFLLPLSSFTIAATNHSCCDNLSEFLRQQWLIGGGKWVGPQEITSVQGLPKLPGDLVFPEGRVKLSRYGAPAGARRRLRRPLARHPRQALAGLPIPVQESQSGGPHFRVHAGVGVVVQMQVFIEKLQPDRPQLAKRLGRLRAQAVVRSGERRTRAAVAPSGFRGLLREVSIDSTARFRQLTGGEPCPVAVQQPLKTLRHVGEAGLEQKSGGEAGQKRRPEQGEIAFGAVVGRRGFQFRENLLRPGERRRGMGLFRGRIQSRFRRVESPPGRRRPGGSGRWPWREPSVSGGPRQAGQSVL